MNFQYFRTLTLAEQESVIQVCSELMQEQAEREKRFEDGFKTPPPPPLESDTAGSGSNKRHLESPHALYDGEAKRVTYFIKFQLMLIIESYWPSWFNKGCTNCHK